MSGETTDVIKDAARTHWVYRAPKGLRPYLQLSRLDRPVGYWLLTLPGWIGLAFASLSYGFDQSDLKWAALILIGAIAMRGAGCTYNDIVDQDLDAQVDRTALRPLPAGTVTTQQAWLWLLAQCAAGLIVLLFLPRLAQIISLCSIPLVAAYPFMKRITWWPQVWLGLTFNWAVLVAYAIKIRAIDAPIIILYLGLVFWTIAYDTIYACQDMEDDAMIGIKSTALRFGKHIKPAVVICYGAFIGLTFLAFSKNGGVFYMKRMLPLDGKSYYSYWYIPVLLLVGFALVISAIAIRFDSKKKEQCLRLFKSNWIVAVFLIFGLYATKSTYGQQLIPGYTPPAHMWDVTNP